MAHIPYGYRIVKGHAVADPEQAEQIRKLVSCYLSGLSLRAAAQESGIALSHAAITHLLDNEVYLGTAFYPAILTREEHERVAAERAARTHPGSSIAAKSYPAAYRFQLNVSEDAVNAEMDRKEVIETLYRMVESSEYGHKSASAEERTWIENCLSNCSPTQDENGTPSPEADRTRSDDKSPHLSEKEQIKLARAEYVRALRAELGYSRDRFAKELGISKNAIFLIEHDKMAVSNKMMERIENRFPRQRDKE